MLACCLCVCVCAQEESYFAGRIVCEVEGGTLNDTAVMLEGDTGLSEGARVGLNLSQLQAYRLFPGQVRLCGCGCGYGDVNVCVCVWGGAG